MKKVNYDLLPTEKSNPRSQNIDILPVEKILSIVNREDNRIPKAIKKAKKQIARAVDLIVSSLQNKGKLYFVGAGTSGRLGVIEAAECPPTFGTPPSLIQAIIAGGRKAVFRSVEGAEDSSSEGYRLLKKKVKKVDVLVGIAASGVTPFVKGALKAAKERRATTILIVASSNSPFRVLADCLIAPTVGPEIIAGSTRLKAGTATKLILNMLTVTSMIRLGKVYQNWMVDVQPRSKKLLARALRLIKRLGNVSNSEAMGYMVKAHMNVKLAILMAKMGYSYQEAVRKLNKASGFLRRALRK